MIVDQFRL